MVSVGAPTHRRRLKLSLRVLARVGEGARAGGSAAPEESSCWPGNQTGTVSGPRSVTPGPPLPSQQQHPSLCLFFSFSFNLLPFPHCHSGLWRRMSHWRSDGMIRVSPLHIPRILPTVDSKTLLTRSCSHTHTHTHAED